MLQPVWRQDQTLTPIAEGDVVDRAFDVVVVWKIDIDAGVGIVAYPIEYASRIVRVFADDIEIPFTNTIGSINIITAPYPRTIQIVMDTLPQLSLLGNDFPVGLRFLNSRLLGILTNIPVLRVVTFTLRATFDGQARDRTFYVNILPVYNAPLIDESALTGATNNLAICPRTFYNFGTSGRGLEYARIVDVIDPDDIAPTIEIINVPDLIAGADRYNGQLPPGLRVEARPPRILGRISGVASFGEYFFELSLNGTTYPVLIAVESNSVSSSRVSRVDWITPAGSLGRVEEIESCSFSVVAKARIAAQPVQSYRLLAEGGDLPHGLTLNSQTGDIEGRPTPVSSTQEFSFVVRASSDTDAVDRQFSITVVSIFSNDQVCELILPLQGQDRGAFEVYNDLIPPTSIYRPGDRNFGVASPPYIHLLSGLPRDANFLPLALVDNPAIRLGAHKTFPWYNGENEYVCDVVVREIYDVWAASEDDENVNSHYEGLLLPSMSVMRAFLSSHYGLYQPTNTISRKPSGGPLPRWMRGSAWFPAVVVAFVKTGMGTDIVNKLEFAPTPARGREMILDRAIELRAALATTQFDANATIIPFVLLANVATIDVGRWAYMTEIHDGVNWLIHEQDFTRLGTTLSFVPVAYDRYFVGLSEGNPNGQPFLNFVGGDTINMGPYLSGADVVLVNNQPLPISNFTPDYDTGHLVHVVDIPPSEVVVRLRGTTFDGELTAWDGDLVVGYRYRKIFDGESLRK